MDPTASVGNGYNGWQHVTQNPYLPPSSEVNDGRSVRPHAGEARVHPGFRFLAALVDWFLFLFIPFLVALLSNTSYTYNHTLSSLLVFVANAVRSTAGWLSLLAWIGLNGFQAYKIATTGQSLGKRLLRMKIVHWDGQPVGFVRSVLLRCWLVYFATLLAPFGLGFVLYFVDALFLFRGDGRCLHDLIAGTRVRDLYFSEEAGVLPMGIRRFGR
jgi:uncharacterized RDD family membrane protein YckC